MEPILPIDLPLVAPAPPARPVARRRRSDDEHPSPREGDDRQRRDEEAEDDGDFPHVDVRV